MLCCTSPYNTLQTSPTNHPISIYKYSQKTLLLSASSGMGMTEPTENLLRTLWTGASRTTSTHRWEYQRAGGGFPQAQTTLHTGGDHGCKFFSKVFPWCPPVNVNLLTDTHLICAAGLSIHIGLTRQYLASDTTSRGWSVLEWNFTPQRLREIHTEAAAENWRRSPASWGQVGRDWVNLKRRPAPSWEALLTQHRWWKRAGGWISCHRCWWRSPTHCMSQSHHWAAPSVTG